MLSKRTSLQDFGLSMPLHESVISLMAYRKKQQRDRDIPKLGLRHCRKEIPLERYSSLNHGFTAS